MWAWSLVSVLIFWWSTADRYELFVDAVRSRGRRQTASPFRCCPSYRDREQAIWICMRLRASGWEKEAERKRRVEQLLHFITSCHLFHGPSHARLAIIVLARSRHLHHRSSLAQTGRAFEFINTRGNSTCALLARGRLLYENNTMPLSITSWLDALVLQMFTHELSGRTYSNLPQVLVRYPVETLKFGLPVDSTMLLLLKVRRTVIDRYRRNTDWMMGYGIQPLSATSAATSRIRMLETLEKNEDRRFRRSRGNRAVYLKASSQNVESASERYDKSNVWLTPACSRFKAPLHRSQVNFVCALAIYTRRSMLFSHQIIHRKEKLCHGFSRISR